MFTVESPQDIIDKLKEYFSEQQFPVKESDKKYKLQVQCAIEGDKTDICIRVENVNEGVHCIKAEMVSGRKMDFLTIFNEIKQCLADDSMLL